VLCFHDDFWSYLEDFDEYSFENLDLFYEEYYQSPLCLDLDQGKDVSFLKNNTCDKVFQLPSITLPCYITKDAIRKHVPFQPSFEETLVRFGPLFGLRHIGRGRSAQAELRSRISLILWAMWTQ
jgi:hypothetical protein